MTRKRLADTAKACRSQLQHVFAEDRCEEHKVKNRKKEQKSELYPQGDAYSAGTDLRVVPRAKPYLSQQYPNAAPL